MEMETISSTHYKVLSSGEVGGKAQGLIDACNLFDNKNIFSNFSSINYSIPEFYVIGTDCFDSFMKQNKLYEFVEESLDDNEIARKFLSSSFPINVLASIKSVSDEIKVPLAVRSSSLLEDKKFEPFAGVYLTKMISNISEDKDKRFHKLLDAIKLVYASVFFKSARDYLKVTNNDLKDEKMAVVIQKVVGKSHDNFFYPTFSGVLKSFNYYPFGKSKPENGINSLALGLGKTIVDGGKSWDYSPTFPKSSSPYSDPQIILKMTQLDFWAINLNEIDKYNPVSESEFLEKKPLSFAEQHGELNKIASTYSVSSDRIMMGVGNDGARIINFTPLLSFNEFKFNDFIQLLLKSFTEFYEQAVEIEFAVNLFKDHLEFGFLQVRPMVVSDANIEITEDEMIGDSVLLASKNVLGNGINEDITDIIYVKQENFDKSITELIAHEIEKLNKKFISQNRKYLLIGFGRWGSTDPWLGIPVDWSQISNAKAIVEAAIFQMNVDLSQGSHFFHNLTSFQTYYFSQRLNDPFGIDWGWLNNLEVDTDLKYIRHVKLNKPLKIMVDGKSGKGIIKKW